MNKDINNRSLFTTKVSFLKSPKATGSITSVDLWTVLEGIRSGEWKEKVEKVRKASPDKQKELKEALPCFMPSGVFSGAKAEDLRKSSGFIAIDLDDKDNSEVSDFDSLKTFLRANPFIAYCARSVRGKGFFCLIPIEEPERHRDYFRSLRFLFSKSGLTVDPSCSDISRKRFVSYDPEPYINTGAEVFSWIRETKDPDKKAKRPETDEEVKTSVESLLSSLEKLSGTVTISDERAPWFECLCALADQFGEEGRDYAHRFSKLSGKYVPTETDSNFDYVLRHNYDYTIGTFFHYARIELGKHDFDGLDEGQDDTI